MSGKRSELAALRRRNHQLKKMPRRKRYQEYGVSARQPSQRQLRLGEELRHRLAELLRPGELRDPALHEANITVTEVRLSPDLRNATAFVVPLAGVNAEEIMAGLRRSAPFLKSRLARLAELRHVPNIGFALDKAFDSAERISRLLASPAVERDLQPETDNGEDA